MLVNMGRYFIWFLSTLSIAAILSPSLFLWLRPVIPFLLGTIMLGIGFSLTVSDLKKPFALKRTIIYGLFIKYTALPLLAYTLAKILKLPFLDFVGLILIAAAPGGTAANVMSYLGKANLAFTVALTFISTLISPLIMPSLVYFFLHHHIDIPFWGIVKSLLEIIIVPIFVGMILKTRIKSHQHLFLRISPVISMLAISLVVACVVAISHARIAKLPILCLVAVIIFNLSSYSIGRLTAVLLGCSPAEEKSLIFEFGMFDTGLAVVVATLFFSASAALPAALLSIIQNLTGAALVRRFNQS